MIRIVHIPRLINTMHAILRYITFRLRTECVNTCHIIHVFRIMMNQIGMYSVITHTIHSLRPSPTKTDTTIRHFTDFIMLDIDVSYISRSNGKASPIFIAYFREIAIIDLLLCAYFPTISRIVWQMRLMGSRRKTAD